MRKLHSLGPRDLSINRREFLRQVAGMGLLNAAKGFSPIGAQTFPKLSVSRRKAVVVTFGGGARDQETFAPEGQENIPHLLSEVLPEASFYSRVVNRGILGHYVATASLVTGVYERFDNFADVAPEHPTIFEYFRRQLRRPPEDAWVIAPSNGFNRIGQSSHPSFRGGSGYGADVILPKRMLEAVPSLHTDKLRHLLQDNYENAFEVPQAQFGDARLSRIETLLKLSLSDFAAHASTLESPDELSVYLAKRLMREVSPSLIWITLHDMDVAHAGAFSLYIDAIRRTDRLCAEIWKAIEAEPEYKDKTNLFIIPDFGRDSDTDPGGNGFQHHRTGDPMSRSTWMIAMGPGVHRGTIVDRPVESIDLAPTIASIFSCKAPFATGKTIQEFVA
ncbi:MAG: hypothetical protein HIU91_10390 [Acidobacteria bacterium]|nr:hypothetical protein [Acidobacteriota bacterium]